MAETTIWPKDLVKGVGELLAAGMAPMMPTSAGPQWQHVFEQVATQAIEKVFGAAEVHETDHWITIEFGDSGEGWAMWRRTGEFYEMHEHAVGDDPIKPTPRPDNALALYRPYEPEMSPGRELYEKWLKHQDVSPDDLWDHLGEDRKLGWERLAEPTPADFAGARRCQHCGFVVESRSRMPER